MTENPFEPDVTITERGAVRIVSFNRPEQLNAVSPLVHQALEGIWRRIAADDSARAIVITGAGRAFSSGADLEWMQKIHVDTAERARSLAEAMKIVREQLACPLPIVAAVNGPAVGLGCNIALHCDIVVMSDDAFFADPHVPIGLTSTDGGAATWPMLLGMMHAKEFLLLGSRISAQEAYRVGLANRVVPQERVLDEAQAIADRLAAMPPQALQSTKRALNIHIERAMTGVLEFTFAAEYQSFDTAEHRAAFQKLLDRRH